MEPTANLDPSRDHRGIELFRAPPPMTRRSILSEEEYSSLTLPPLVSPEAHRQPTYPGPTSDSRSAPTSAPSQRYSSTSYADTNADYSRQHRSAHNTRHPEPSTTEHRQLPSLQRSNSTNTSSSPYPSQYYQRPSSAHGSNTNAYSTTRYADGPGGTPTTSRPHHHRRHSPPPLSYRAPRTITPPPVRHYPALMPATSSHARSSSRQRSSSAQRGTAQATAGTQARVGSVGPRSPPRIREERTAERAAVPPSVAATRTYAERGSSSSESLKSSGGFGGAGGVGGPAGSSSASRRRQSSPKRRRIGIRELVD